MTSTCPHPEVGVIPTPELMHYAKEVCRSCKRFVRWLPHPETLENDKRNAELLKSLSAINDRLTDWEKKFTFDLAKQGRHFSPKQKLWLDKIAQKYGF